MKSVNSFPTRRWGPGAAVGARGGGGGGGGKHMFACVHVYYIPSGGDPIWEPDSPPPPTHTHKHTQVHDGAGRVDVAGGVGGALAGRVRRGLRPAPAAHQHGRPGQGGGLCSLGLVSRGLWLGLMRDLTHSPPHPFTPPHQRCGSSAVQLRQRQRQSHAGSQRWRAGGRPCGMGRPGT